MYVKNRHTNVIRISCTQEKEIFISNSLTRGYYVYNRTKINKTLVFFQINTKC